NFCDDIVFLAGNFFHRHCEVRMGAILVGEVECANATFEGIAKEAVKIFAAKARLVGLLLHAAGAGAHGETGNFKAGFTESDFFEGVEIFWDAGCGGGSSGGFNRSEASADQHAAEADGRSFQKFTTLNFHRHSVSLTGFCGAFRKYDMAFRVVEPK